MRRLYTIVSEKDTQLNLYAGDVLHHAKIKKGCKICDHGVSCAKSAELLDISQWELMQYMGKTTYADQVPPGIDMRTRLNIARSMFS